MKPIATKSENREFFYLMFHKGAKGDWDFRISDLVKNLDGTDI